MQINSFEEACEARGYDPALILPDVSKQPEWLQKFTLASVKRVIIAEAMNAGKQFDWSDTNQRKWFPYFDMDDSDAESGFGFSSTDCVRGIRVRVSVRAFAFSPRKMPNILAGILSTCTGMYW